MNRLEVNSNTSNVSLEQQSVLELASSLRRLQPHQLGESNWAEDYRDGCYSETILGQGYRLSVGSGFTNERDNGAKNNLDYDTLAVRLFKFNDGVRQLRIERRVNNQYTNRDGTQCGSGHKETLTIDLDNPTRGIFIGGETSYQGCVQKRLREFSGEKVNQTIGSLIDQAKNLISDMPQK